MSDEPVELTCYLLPGWEPDLRPAPHQRAWMDQSPLGFANRCLPLTIANAHGWEAPSPCGFSAVWSGGDGPGDVRIVPDMGSEPHRRPTSVFGCGVLTFHFFGLIRTSPGWNLWVGGSPNHFKDGIQPLTGVVETDWAPFSFTMNWRFTRPGHWVRFEKGEPICFFFPVPRGVLAAVQPRYAPLDSNPDLKAQFEAWSASRNAFHAKIAREPVKPADGWQKDYFKGIDMKGHRFPEHETKLRLRPFQAG